MITRLLEDCLVHETAFGTSELIAKASSRVELEQSSTRQAREPVSAVAWSRQTSSEDMRSRRSSPKLSPTTNDMFKTSASYRRDVESGRAPIGVLSRLTPRRVIVGAVVGCSVVGYLWLSGALDQESWSSLPIIPGGLSSHGMPAPKDPVTSFVVDEFGDQFLYDYPLNIPTFDPDISLLPSPDELFTSVNLKTHFHLPQANAYPDAKLSDVHNPPRHPPLEITKNPVPTDAYSKKWQAPEGWDEGGVDMPKVQARKFNGDRRLMKKRREAVRRGFAHAWQAYKDFAWGMSVSRLKAELD